MQGRELKCHPLHGLAQLAVSPLVQGRELKFVDDRPMQQAVSSPLVQGRELKYVWPPYRLYSLSVAPRAGA